MHKAFALAITLWAGALSARAQQTQPMTDHRTPATRPRTVDITIARETTYITAPVCEDGTVDYFAYLNEKYGEGVTPENNAVVPLIKILGKDVLADDVRDETLKRMGIQEPVGESIFVDLDEYVEEHAPAAELEPETRPVDPEVRRFYEEHDLPWEPAERVVPAVENAHDAYQEAMKSPWTAEQYPMIAGWLKANGKAMASAREAAERERHFFPLVPNEDWPGLAGMLLPSINGWRSVSKMLTARAMLHAGEGRYEEAAADLLAVHRLARLVSHSPWLISRLVGMALESVAASAESRWAMSGNLSAEQAHDYLKRLQALEPLSSIAEAVNVERFVVLDTIQMIARGHGRKVNELLESCNHQRYPMLYSPLLHLNWDLMLREANSYYDGAAEAAGAGFYEKQLPLWDRCEAQQEALVEEIARQGGMNPGFMWMITRARNAEDIDRISRMLAQRIVVITMPSLARLSQLTESTNVHSILSQIAFALAAYKDAYGEYPAALDALTPKYFDKLPVDRFTEKALHYRRLDDGGFTLYSVGADMEDDGGVEGVEDCDVVVTTAEQE